MSPSKPPTIRDVSKAAGVSTATVSHVLNRPELVADATRARVEQVIHELGYVRNASARQLSDGRSHAVGLVIRFGIVEANPFNMELARGVEDAVREEGYVVIVCNSLGSTEQEDKNLRLLGGQRVEGVLITPVGSSKIPGLDRLRADGSAVVLVDHRGGRDECSVSVDDVSGGKLAARHFAELGHERVGIVNGPGSIRPNADRRKGFLAELGRHEIEVAPDHDIATEVLSADAGEIAAGALLDRPGHPTALFCGNDLMAIGVLRAALARGLSVPDDLAIIGFDDVIFAQHATVPLTSIRQPTYQLGYSSAKLLLDEARNRPTHTHERLIFKPELVVRESTVGRKAVAARAGDGTAVATTDVESIG